MCIILNSPDQRIDHFLFERGQCNGKCFFTDLQELAPLPLFLSFAILFCFFLLIKRLFVLIYKKCLFMFFDV